MTTAAEYAELVRPTWEADRTLTRELVLESWEVVDPDHLEPRLAEVDPTGAAYGYLATAREYIRPDTAGDRERRRLDAQADPETMAELERLRLSTNGTNPSVRTALTDCVDVFSRWLYMPNPVVLHAVLGTYVANFLDGDPLWLLAVGPPSSGKTEVVNAVSHRPGVHQAATITEAALLSGTPKKQSGAEATGGLLRKVGDFGILVLKDFTSVLAQNHDTRSQVLAALREVFDGAWTRHVGTDGGKTLAWEGKVGLIGGCTPTIDRHHAVLSALGDRFILIRQPEVDPEDVSRRAMAHIGREREMRQDLAAAVDAVVDRAPIDRDVGELDEASFERIRDLAIFAVRARSAVERDGYTQDVLVMPEPEGPPRFLLSLRRLMAGLECVGCTPDETWAVLNRVAVDSMPKVRRQVIDALAADDSELLDEGPRPTTVVAIAAELPNKTAKRTLEDLHLLGLVDRASKGTAQNSGDLWSLSTFTRRYAP